MDDEDYKGPPTRFKNKFEPTDAQALQYMQSSTTHGKVFRMANGTLKFPKKKRFN